MKAKLTKITGIYTLLHDNDKMIASDDVDMQKDYEIGKLSKQNCDEIFGIIDIEKLAEEYDPNYAITDISNGFHFIEGFNKAMELNKDKVFTLEDMKNAMNWMMTQYFEFYEQPTTGRREQYLESIQQPTEIEVEIEMKKVVDETKVIGAVKGVKGSGDKITTYKTVPKLDSEGCLILKRIV